jgi:NADPH:quinone reductase-like Zn-dependent oxidoreductase
MQRDFVPFVGPGGPTHWAPGNISGVGSVGCFDAHTMKAAIYRRYGPPEVVQIAEVEKPVPKAGDVLVRVRASTVCAADWRLRKADPFVVRAVAGLWRPKKTGILGMEFAGTVESVGSNVTRFGAGDQVFGGTLFKFGTHAEYVCLPETGLLAKKPDNMPLEEAAAVFFGGMTVLGFLAKARIHPGQKVLVYGASGSVGVFAVQLAKHFGAHVTAVCSTDNLAWVKSLGADDVVDYTKEDFSRAGRVYDMVFDTVGKSGFWRSLRSLKRGGSYLLVGGFGRKTFVGNVVGGVLGGMWGSVTGAARVVGMPKHAGIESILLLKELIEAGKVKTVIERRYSLGEIAEAHRHAEAGHKKGHVLVMLESSDSGFV